MGAILINGCGDSPVIYLVPENNPVYDKNDWRIVVRCTEHLDYSCTFPGVRVEFEALGLPGNVVAAGEAIIEANEHIRMFHIALPANMG